MRTCSAVFMCTLLMAGVALADPPGTLDGMSIPSDFATGEELAVQTNRTGFGDQQITLGDYTPGSEANELFVAQDAEYLYIGITGNLERNGHAFVIFVNDLVTPGQIELRAEGVGGPPFSVQTASAEIVINTNGTPGDATDDTWSYGAMGTVLPCEADFALAVDTFGGTMSISEYFLSDPMFGAVGQNDPTPENPNDPLQDLFATRNFVGQSPLNDLNDVMENQVSPDYGPAGFDNTNTTGVTDVDASMAAAATTGFEVGIPLTRFIGSDLQVMVVMMDGSGSTGTIVPQTLPPVTDVDICTSGMAIGLRPNLTSVFDCLDLNLDIVPQFTGTADGIIDPAEYGVAMASAVQACRTPYGDQQFDPNLGVVSGGSELNALYASNDDEFLYLGITGNVEPGGNTMHIFIDSDPEGADLGQFQLVDVDFVPFQALLGMAGDILAADMPYGATTNGVFYNVAYGINLDGGNNNVYVDFWDLVNTNGTYRGSSQRNSGDGTLSGGTNPNGMIVALNNLNEDGVLGCGDGEPCHLETAANVATLARSATLGFEIAVPLADLGISSMSFPHTVKIWVYITGSGGFGSDQSLPSLRNVSSNGLQVQNAGDGPNDYTDPFEPTLYRNFEGRAATYVLEEIGGCQSTAACPNADVNCDNVTSGLDIAIITNSANFGLPVGSAANPRADVNGDGTVSGLDVAAAQSSACFGL